MIANTMSKPERRAVTARMLQQASDLRAAGRLNEALGVCRQLLALEPQNGPGLALAGLLCWSRGDYMQALPLLERAARLQPTDAEAQSNLGAVLQSLGRFNEAVAAYRHAISLKPDYIKAHGNLGAALLRIGRFDQAIAAFRRTLEIDSRYAEAESGLGVALRKVGQFAEAAEACRRAIALAPKNASAYSNLAAALLAGGDAAGALAACDQALTLQPGNTRDLSFKAGVLEALGEREEFRRLVDYERLIELVKIKPPQDFPSVDDFNQALADQLSEHRSLRYEPNTKPTRAGWQTNEMLVKPEGPAAALKGLITEAVQGYLTNHPHDPDHPFLASPPKSWRLKGWGTVLPTHGHQDTHIHLPGWLSGVYYVKVPTDMAPANDEGDQAGWIEFGRPGKDVPAKLDPEVKLIKPEEGVIVLFPSYFHHRTLPFRAEERRISFAFDVIVDH